MDAEAVKELETLRYMQSLYSQEYEAMIKNLSSFISAAGAMERSIEAVGGLEKMKGTDVLVSAEAGAYLSVNVAQTGKVLVYVGANYMVEKDVESAVAFLKTAYQKNARSIAELNKQRSALESEMIELDYRVAVLDNELSTQQ